MLIAQLSDPHLRPPGVLYQGLVDSNAMFAAALDQLASLDPQPDLVLLSGDLVDEGTEAEYAQAAALLARLRVPLLVIPGNHDCREAFRRSFVHHPHLPASGPLHFAVDGPGPLRVLGLDVTVPGAHHGEMDAAACAWLEARLAEQPGRPTLIMMHQPPFASGIPFIDPYRCHGGERLAEIVARHPSVERILCGHVHRFMQLRFAGALLMTAPSTTTALALRLAPGAEPASFVEPPGMLLHHWRLETGLVTHLVPIGSFRGPLPFF
ncbi:phosphodiesterase [Falsiroseomonas sp.]|uniref:phosphodiesterase n=1 Tax=Falsiroseomonas sp. TaxID=2870721 RepID=UPI003F71F3BD